MAKEVKKVKCKGCKLTYDKKLYKCPYCHRKRFNPTGLIIFLIILILALGAAGYFYWDEIKEFIADKQTETVLDENEGKGLVFKNVSVTRSEEYDNVYTVKFDIENKTRGPLKENYILANLADKVKATVLEGKFLYWGEDYEQIQLDMLADEIYKAEYNLKIDEEWQILEIYLREPESETGGTNDIKVFTYENNLPKIETTVSTEIVTEAATDETSETISEENQNSKIEFKNLTVTKSSDNIYTINFDIENKTDNRVSKIYQFTNLVDKTKAKVIQGDVFYNKYDYKDISLNIMPEEIYKAEYNIIIDNEWENLEIYLTEENSDTDLKIFTYKNDLQEETTESTTTQISIITE